MCRAVPLDFGGGPLEEGRAAWVTKCGGGGGHLGHRRVPEAGEGRGKVHIGQAPSLWPETTQQCDSCWVPVLSPTLS